MPMVKAPFALMISISGCVALAQDKETCETKDVDPTVAVFVYVDLDGSGKLEEILLTSNPDGDVTIDVAFDVPEKRGDEYSSDPDLGLEIKDVNGDKLDDLSLVVDGKTVGLVDADWASLAKDGCGKEDYESDVQVIYRQQDEGVPDRFTMGPVSCVRLCDDWELIYGNIWQCVDSYWSCVYRGVSSNG